MSFLGRMFGSDPDDRGSAERRHPTTEDERAVERYRYLLSTAPPETIEQVHAEAFAKLTEEQRAQIYEELSRGAGTGERPLSSEPATLARAATRAEMRDPGTLERTFQGPGRGGMFTSSLLGTIAGYVIASALVSAFLPWDSGFDETAAAGEPGGVGEDADSGGGDFGGDFGF